MPPIPKINEPFELLIVLISVDIFDADLMDYISDTLVLFDEVKLLELGFMVDSMTAYDLFCKLEM